MRGEQVGHKLPEDVDVGVDKLWLDQCFSGVPRQHEDTSARGWVPSRRHCGHPAQEGGSGETASSKSARVWL